MAVRVAGARVLSDEIIVIRAEDGLGYARPGSVCVWLVSATTIDALSAETE